MLDRLERAFRELVCAFYGHNWYRPLKVDLSVRGQITQEDYLQCATCGAQEEVAPWP